MIHDFLPPLTLSCASDDSYPASLWRSTHLHSIRWEYRPPWFPPDPSVAPPFPAEGQIPNLVFKVLSSLLVLFPTTFPYLLYPQCPPSPTMMGSFLSLNLFSDPLTSLPLPL